MCMRIHSRHSVRLQGYDYSSSGYYFVTVCVKDRSHLFGEISDKKLIPNKMGEIVSNIWKSLPQMGVINHAPTIRLDAFQLMPDHVHGIVIIDPCVGAQFIAPTLGQIIRKFKSICSLEMHRNGINKIIWQRGFYEHIIRSERELMNVRRYILSNPERWEPL